MGLAVLGGSIGAWLGMVVWHHKTRHKKFRYGIPIILTLQIVLLFCFSCKAQQQAQVVPAAPADSRYTPEHSPDVFLVMYDAEIGEEPLLRAIKEYKCEIIYDYGIINGMALRKPDGKTLEETMRYFKDVEGVVSVEYDHIYHLTDPVKPK